MVFLFFRFLALVVILATGLSSPAMAQIADYYTPLAEYSWGKVRGFNFNGNRPFVNPIIAQADIASFQFNGLQINGASITNNGSNDQHIVQFFDAEINENVTRVILSSDDALTAGSHRTQLNSYPIESKKRYILDLEFKLDDNWDFSMNPGIGLIWQLKGSPKSGQYGNPVLGINLNGDQLNMSILYPTTAANATVWPTSITWVANQYVPVSIAPKTITRGEYHRIQLIFFADDAPNKPINDPVKPEGKGFISAILDGQPWFEYVGPTLHPDQAGLHNTSWGWYQWSGAPSENRIIYYRKNQLYEWK